jgi:hypothetical protein
MSFIRPELSQALSRWREPLLWVALIAVGLLFLWRGMAREAAWLLLLGGSAALVGVLMLRSAVGRARLSALPPGEGVVLIDEGRIAYFGPVRGGFLDLESITCVEVVAGDTPLWRLSGSDGIALDIPFAARGAEHLPDALSALPGIAIAHGISAIYDATGAPRTIWHRERRAAPPIPRRRS